MAGVEVEGPDRTNRDLHKFRLDEFKNLMTYPGAVDLENQEAPLDSEIAALQEKLQGLLNDADEKDRTVLGIDIKGYSKFDPFQRRIVPALFHHLFEQVVEKVGARREPAFASAAGT